MFLDEFVGNMQQVVKILMGLFARLCCVECVKAEKMLLAGKVRCVQ